MYWIDTSAQTFGSPQQISFLADSSSDIANLPTSTTEGVQQGDDTVSCRKCPKGSFCITIAEGAGYFLNSNDQWVEV